MSYFVCPDTLKRYNVFGESHIEEIASKENLEVLAKLPIDSELTTACDKGLIETYGGLILDKVVEKLERL
ncbi:MAG: P-loop NTPase, partial [Erysipelotrichales bacterium]|nr:P-loop NTPase [Erysipelotrichales bacterium]